MDLRKKLFFAYASQPDETARIITDAISMINQQSQDVLITDWRSMSVSGQWIIHQICKNIEESDLFLCDLTTDNYNVLFELGYAIAKSKPVWMTVHKKNYDEEKRYKRLRQITTLGYESYDSSHELVNKFLTKQPQNDNNPSLLDMHSGGLADKSQDHSYILFLKNQSTSTASRRLFTAVRNCDLQVVVDDPLESTGQSLNWYIEQVYAATAVLAHLSGQSEVAGDGDGEGPIYALICGMAYGFDKSLLMLSSATGKFTPIDYRDLTRLCTSDNDYVRFFNDWLNDVKQSIPDRKAINKQRGRFYEATNKLNKIQLGHYLAENEESFIDNYFIETTAFRDAIESRQYTLFIGRKGTGKTANLYQIANYIKDDSRNFVCIIKPVDYQFEAIFNLFQLSKSIAGKGYLIESLWKFLIYTELAVSIYTYLLGRPSHMMRTEADEELCTYVEQNEKILKAEFSERMESAIRDICELNIFDNSSEQRQVISEKLHERVLSRLRNLIGEVLASKERVFILVDNLDKGWQQRPDLETLADFLFGLFGVNEKIARDFHSNSFRKQHVNLSLVVFIRSDIFSYVEKRARERDKLPKKGINWNDPELLGRVIEERISASLGEDLTPSEIWSQFFPKTINNLPTRDYIVSRIIRRPRDMIFLCKEALSNAKNHRHTIIEVDDILKAEDPYSHHVYSTLVTETLPEFPTIEEFFLKLVGEDEIVTHSRIMELAEQVGISEEQQQDLVDSLCDNLFLGVEINRNEFTFFYDEEKKPILKSKAEKFSIGNAENRRYRINVPFHRYLEVTKNPDIDV